MTLLAVGCGSSHPSDVDGGLALACGPGTVEVDGVCVLADGGFPCRPGELYDEHSGECLEDTRCPDGHYWDGVECVAEPTCGPGTEPVGRDCVPSDEVCGEGTRFDEATRTCVADETGCGDGTVFVDGRCVAYDDTLEADHDEGPEDNDPTFGGAPLDVPFPEVGGATTLRGCFEPTGVDLDGDGAPEPDRDGFRFEVTEPVVVHVRVDGVGGASGGFVLTSEVAELPDSAWRREAISVVGDVAVRDVFLPVAGAYVLVVSDARAILHGADVGGSESCYFAAIERGPALSEVALAAGPVTGTLVAPRAHRWVASTDGAYRAALSTEGMLESGALLVLDGGEVVAASVARGASELGLDLGMRSAGAELLIVTELERRYSVVEPTYALEVIAAP